MVKVKDGHTGEIHAEVAATACYRLSASAPIGCFDSSAALLWMSTQSVLRGDGSSTTSARARPLPDRFLTNDIWTEWVAVERRLDGTAVETDNKEGWSWFELDAVDPAHGANRAERDALRLLAMFWRTGITRPRINVWSSGRNHLPTSMISGRLRAEIAGSRGWRQAPVWSDRATCSVSMKRFPPWWRHFPTPGFPEAGELLARQLSALDDQQVNRLFAAARFAEFDPSTGVSARAETFLVEGPTDCRGRILRIVPESIDTPVRLIA